MSVKSENGRIIYIKAGHLVVSLTALLLTLAGTLWAVTTSYTDHQLTAHRESAMPHETLCAKVNANNATLTRMERKLDSLIIEVSHIRKELNGR